MAVREIEQSYNVTGQSNAGYASASALQIRLETNQIIENIELFLRGAKTVTYQDEESGVITTKSVSVGNPKCNDVGIQSILNWIQLIINPQVVQGNFPSDQQGVSLMYDDYIFHARVDLATHLAINMYLWEITEEDYELIIDQIMNITEPFMTRLIDNKERESYDTTIRHSESNTIKENQQTGKFFQQQG